MPSTSGITSALDNTAAGSIWTCAQEESKRGVRCLANARCDRLLSRRGVHRAAPPDFLSDGRSLSAPDQLYIEVVAPLAEFPAAMLGNKTLGAFLLGARRATENLALVCNEDFPAFNSPAAAQSPAFGGDEFVRF